jgi:hypothetical protein
VGLTNHFQGVDGLLILGIENPAAHHINISPEAFLRSGLAGIGALDSLLAGCKMPQAIDLEISLTAKVVLETCFTCTYVHIGILPTSCNGTVLLPGLAPGIVAQAGYSNIRANINLLMRNS